MNSPVANMLVSMTFAGSFLLGTSSCTSVPTDTDATAPPRSAQVLRAQRLVQFDFGAQATFGICFKPACPAITPKTLPTGNAGSD